MTPTDTQAAAIHAIVDWFNDTRSPQEFYLAGYAGVGKSTVANIAIEELREKSSVSNIVTGAFTGKAAHVLRRKGVKNAQTIHSMIYTLLESPQNGDPVFTLAEDGPASDADLIILDECSMVGQEIADDLRSFDKKILVLGDPGQLPPIKGQGAFTVRKPDFFLREIHRQAADSPIIQLATQARNGERIKPGDYGDGVIVQRLTRDTQHAVYSDSTQAICGKHTVRHAYTQRIRQRRGFKSKLPQPGERVICCRNDKAKGLFNGALGDLLKVSQDRTSDGLILDVHLEDVSVEHKGLSVNPWLFRQHFETVERPRIRKGIQEFDWGYVLTCHKAQGSEWPHVTIVDDSRTFRDDADRWLYTAITRASEGLTLLLRS